MSYEEEVDAWPWDDIVAEAKKDALSHSAWQEDCFDDCDQDGHVGVTYLGSVMSIYPSGKYWTVFTSNQTDEDVKKDTEFGEALEQAADKNGGTIISGEGDPTDLYFQAYFDMSPSEI